MYLVIDIGGTKTLIARFSRHGRCLYRDKFPTPNNLQDFLDTLFAHLELISQYNFASIAVAIPGLVQGNRPVWFGNRPWKSPAIAETIKKLFNCPIYFENDANLATIYESKFYSKLSIYLTFSTGIGGGIACRGHLASESATFEPGHQIYQWPPTSIKNSTASRPLEWEDIASCAALNQIYGKPVDQIRDKQSIIDIALRISIGIADIITTYQPYTIIIGGPLALLFPRLKKPLIKILSQTLSPDIKLPQFTIAKRPRESVIYGGYRFLKSQEHRA